MQSWAAGRNHKLNVYGPPGVEQVVAGFEQAYSLDTGYRVQYHGEEWMPRAAAGAIAQPINLKNNEAAALVFERNGLKVTAFKVEHDPASPAYGYRFEYRGRIVVVSGDTARSDNLARHAAGADLLIHDVIAKNLLQMAASNFDRTARKDVARHHDLSREPARGRGNSGLSNSGDARLHPYGSAAKQSANRAGVPARRERHIRSVSDTFKGKVVIGTDGMRFDLPPRN